MHIAYKFGGGGRVGKRLLKGPVNRWEVKIIENMDC
jgi:hypothetical protein